MPAGTFWQGTRPNLTSRMMEGRNEIGKGEWSVDRSGLRAEETLGGRKRGQQLLRGAATIRKREKCGGRKYGPRNREDSWNRRENPLAQGWPGVGRIKKGNRKPPHTKKKNLSKEKREISKGQ